MVYALMGEKEPIYRKDYDKHSFVVASRKQKVKKQNNNQQSQRTLRARKTPRALTWPV